MTLLTSPPNRSAAGLGLRSQVHSETLRAVPRPGLFEQVLTVAVIFINQFGTPATWFRTTSTRVVESDVILTFGSLAIVGLLLISLIGHGDAVVRALTAAPALSIYFAVVAFSPIWSDYLVVSVNRSANAAVSIALAIVLLVRHSWQDILRLVVIAAAIGILMDLFWVLAMGPMGVSPTGWTGLSTQKNGLGLDGLIGAIVFLFAARTFRRFRFPLYSMALVSLVLLIGSESKTSLGTVIVTAGSLIVFAAFRSKKTLKGAVVITLIVGVTMSVLFVTANLTSIVGQFGKDTSFTGRVPLWSEAMAGVLERPWLGYGFGGFFNGPLSPAHWITAFEPFQWNPTHSHNAILESALHVGIPATILYVFFHVQALIRATNHVQLVKGPAGLFPLVYLTAITMLSTTESGIFGMRFGLTLFVVSVILAKVGVDDAKRNNGLQLLESADRSSGGQHEDEESISDLFSNA